MWNIAGVVCCYCPNLSHLQQSGKRNFIFSFSDHCVVRLPDHGLHNCPGGIVMAISLLRCYVFLLFLFLPLSLSVSLSWHSFSLSSFYIFCMWSLLFYIFLLPLYLSLSKYITHSFSLTVCHYFIVFFQVLPLSRYVSLSVCLSVCLSLCSMSF